MAFEANDCALDMEDNGYMNFAIRCGWFMFVNDALQSRVQGTDVHAGWFLMVRRLMVLLLACAVRLSVHQLHHGCEKVDVRTNELSKGACISVAHDGGSHSYFGSHGRCHRRYRRS